MVYYKDYRLTIIETDGKYTLYDAKYGGRAVHQNKTKEWTDDYIQRVSKLRGRRRGVESLKLKQETKNNLQKSLIDSGSFDSDTIDKIMEVFDKVTAGYTFKKE